MKDKERVNRLKNATSTNNKSQAEISENMRSDLKCGDGINSISPGIHEASYVDRTNDGYIYTQPEMDIDNWEIKPQPYR